MRLQVKRYSKNYGCCAIAACTSLANFYNPKITYKDVFDLAKLKIKGRISSGFYSGEIGILLNLLGFQKVKLITSDLNIVDYSWSYLDKSALKKRLKRASKRIEPSYRESCFSLYQFLDQINFKNEILIDYDFGKYIRNFLDQGKPLGVSFNWTMLHRADKKTGGKKDPYKGQWEEHIVVASGYNKRGVYIVDSYDGFYQISFEHLMSVMAFGDVHLPDSYIKKEKNEIFA